MNKEVFEPSYNDLKFIVWNHCYICNNLIKILHHFSSLNFNSSSLFLFYHTHKIKL